MNDALRPRKPLSTHLRGSEAERGVYESSRLLFAFKIINEQILSKPLNMKKSTNLLRNILRMLGSITAILYILFLIDEGVPLFTEKVTFAEISVYLLFLVFILGYYFLWKNELISGLILIAWHGLQWFLVYWVWVDGSMTLILGIPLGLFGIIILMYGMSKNISSKTNR